MYFLCSFQKFYDILQKFCKYEYNQNISGWTSTYFDVLPLGYTSATLRYPRAIRPSQPRYEFMILFDFQAPSVKLLTGNDAILVSG